MDSDSPSNGRLLRTAVVLVSIYLILVANGAMFLLAVSLKELALDFGWPRSVPSSAYAFLFVGVGFGGIVMGAWFDRSGAGPVTLLGTIMIGLGALLTSYVQSAWQLYFIYGVMIGFLGQATIYGPLVLNIMRWFETRRGFAVGLITAGQGLGGAIWPPVFHWFNEAAGWRETFWWFGVFILITGVPLTFVLRRQRVGVIEKKAAAMKVNRSRTTSGSSLALPPWMLQTILCLAILGCCVSMSMPLAHVVAHASDLGHPAARAAELLSIALLMATVVRLTGGTLIVDRFGGLIALFTFSSLQAAGLVLYAFVDGLLGLYLVSALFGLGYGGINMCYPVIVREHLPAQEAGRRLGIVLLFGALGMALGGWLAGLIFDHTGSYRSAFLAGAAFNGANLILIAGLVFRARGGASTTPLPVSS